MGLLRRLPSLVFVASAIACDPPMPEIDRIPPGWESAKPAPLQLSPCKKDGPYPVGAVSATRAAAGASLLVMDAFFRCEQAACAYASVHGEKASVLVQACDPNQFETTPTCNCPRDVTVTVDAPGVRQVELHYRGDRWGFREAKLVTTVPVE